MRAKLFAKALVMLLLPALLITGCSSNRTPPEPQPPKPPPPPEIPVPFSDASFTNIVDIAFEMDNEVAIADAELGLYVYDEYGVMKRNLSPTSAQWTGLADVVPFYIDKNAGVIATGPAIDCAWETLYDDLYFPGENSFPDYPEKSGWWAGIAHSPPGCNPNASSGQFECPPYLPQGIDLHPIYGWLFLRVEHSKVTIDPDCGLEPSEIPEHWDMTGGILAVHPAAPTQGFDPEHWEGGADYVVYHDKTDSDAIDSYGYPMARDAVQIIAWDLTHPFTMLPFRDGINSRNISDFEFDAYGRLVIVLPNANAFVITEPVVPPNMIIVDRIIGGHTSDPGDKPGEFYNPTAVAVSPLEGEIYITDTGNDRVQVFESNGNFIRMFGRGIGHGLVDFTGPTAIDIDSFGNVYVAVEEEPHLMVLDMYGQPLSYGTIEGYVRDKSTNQILDNVLVSIGGINRIFITVTDENGFFRFPMVPQGEHTIFATRAGYAAGVANLFVVGSCMSEVTIYLDRTGISGSWADVIGTVVSSLDGDPIPGLEVRLKGFGIYDTTTEKGEFHLTGVPHGAHVLQILSNSIVIYEQDIWVEPDAVTQLGYIYLPI